MTTLVLGCSTPRRQTVSEPPTIIIHQLPDYPMPGRGSEFPGGLVAALWPDGRLVRATAVGKSYVEGAVARDQRDQFFSFLSTAAGAHQRLTASHFMLPLNPSLFAVMDGRPSGLGFCRIHIQCGAKFSRGY